MRVLGRDVRRVREYGCEVFCRRKGSLERKPVRVAERPLVESEDVEGEAAEMRCEATEYGGPWILKTPYVPARCHLLFTTPTARVLLHLSGDFLSRVDSMSPVAGTTYAR